MQPSALSSPPQRLAWFVGGVAASLATLALLGPAFALQESEAPRPFPMGASGMSADSNNRMVAVTGVDITGQSVLYLVDSWNMQLAVYQASGGAGGTQNIKLVGARRIDLDLQLHGFNDKTELDGQPLTYDDLAERFDEDVEDDGR
ncbi:MAG: hypothetical protein AAF957_02230 [Planctomycetota bacterium]